MYLDTSVFIDTFYRLDKMKYPSVTFCYKFKHGSKDVVQNYYPFLFEVAKQKGNFVQRLKNNNIKTLKLISNHII